MRFRTFIGAGFAAFFVVGCSSFAAPQATTSSPAMQRPLGARTAVAASRRVIYFYQTQYYQGTYVSLSPILRALDPRTRKPYTTDVIVAAFHLGYNTNHTPYIHLNDNPPGDPMFNVMWPEVAKLQHHGVTARMMLGGAAQGSYAVLFSHWNTFYPILKGTLQRYKLDGIDLDVEETVSLADIEKLIDRLSSDFGSHFRITLAPVASALWGGANLSGFDYKLLYTSPAGKKIAWFDAQFYSGFATLATTADYDRVIRFGYPADKVVAGMIANPADGSGFIPIDQVATTVTKLTHEHAAFGGVFAWEYFNAEPGGIPQPARWSAVMADAMAD